jgi:hypothetical protein
MVNFDQPVAELVGLDIDPVELVDNNDPRFRAYIPDSGHIDITFTEPLGFHHERAVAGSPPAGGQWADCVDSDGKLTSTASQRLIAQLRTLTGVGDIERQPDAEFDDEPCWAVSFRTDVLAGETLAQWHQRIGWPVIATVINTTDPGTFNSPYLFSVLTDQ